MVERCGISNEEFDCLVARIVSHGDDVPESVEGWPAWRVRPT
jgi:hypothetical protein